ncbi:MAG: rhomboid family intramembrane serine protease [Bacteroidetes bacterium GWA2_31_9b]|nr:MAG: rhomboid family intramembrane serine protease [Bacteroidetes bacterium GWA2_31_9b]
MSIVDEIKQSFKSGSSLTKLIYINLSIFLIVRLFDVFLKLFTIESGFSLVTWLAVPADISILIHRPWTVISYMFLHFDFLHILFNMLWLYWFGQIFLHYFDNKKLLSVYIVGGIAGAFVYILTFNIFPLFTEILPVSFALGASASVIAIVIAVSVYAPNHTIYLLFFGAVKLKYIALATILIDVISIASTNAGGHLAHLGGAFFGYFYILQYKKGKNLTKYFDRIMDMLFSVFKPRPKIKVSYRRPVDDIEYNKSKVQKQAEIDKILDKIAKSGYDSLSKQEKETLFKNSK